jgi:hypothetical protein
MNPQTQVAHPPTNSDQVDDSLLTALKTEVGQEVQNMERTGDLADPGQSDVLVQKHFPGLFIILLVLVTVLLLLAIGGIFLYHR